MSMAGFVEMGITQEEYDERIRNKAIDEFASKLIMHFADWKMSESHSVIVDTIDQAMEGVEEIAEKMKKG